jgi:hypothetical protein
MSSLSQSFASLEHWCISGKINQQQTYWSCSPSRTSCLGFSQGDNFIIALYKISEPLLTCTPIHVPWFGIILWCFLCKFICQFHDCIPWATIVHIADSDYIIINLRSSSENTAHTAHLLVYANFSFPLLMWFSKYPWSVVYDSLNCFAAALTDSPLF